MSMAVKMIMVCDEHTELPAEPIEVTVKGVPFVKDMCPACLAELIDTLGPVLADMRCIAGSRQTIPAEMKRHIKRQYKPKVIQNPNIVRVLPIDAQRKLGLAEDAS